MQAFNNNNNNKKRYDKKTQDDLQDLKISKSLSKSNKRHKNIPKTFCSVHPLEV